MKTKPAAVPILQLNRETIARLTRLAGAEMPMNPYTQSGPDDTGWTQHGPSCYGTCETEIPCM